MMDKDFSQPQGVDKRHEKIWDNIVELFKWRYDESIRILDIGSFNHLTAKLAKIYKIDNTAGDLDEPQIISSKYDVVLMSHIIEHLFNPLGCLIGIRGILKHELVIATPIVSEELKFKPSTSHFHEFDDYRLTKLIKRAGFDVEEKYYAAGIHGGIHGIRPILRKLTMKEGIYICRKK